MAGDATNATNWGVAVARATHCRTVGVGVRIPNRDADTSQLPRGQAGSRWVPTLRSRKGRSRSTWGSLGSPSTRSPMMLRWISLVPPAMAPAGADSEANAHRLAFGVSAGQAWAAAPA